MYLPAKLIRNASFLSHALEFLMNLVSCETLLRFKDVFHVRII